MLRAYFDELERMDRGGTSLLDPAAVLEHSKLFAFHPTVQKLGGYVLDDENTSDHHLLVTTPCLAGSVFFLSHDGNSRIVFDTSASFLKAVEEARDRGLLVADLHPALSPVANDQQALRSFVCTLLETTGQNDVVVSLIPSLDLHDMELLQRLAMDTDFYLAEAVATEIGRRPSTVLLPIAMLCREHPHPQVARAGLRAGRRIEQLAP